MTPTHVTWWHPLQCDISMRTNFAAGTRKPTGALFFASVRTTELGANPANGMRAKKWSTILAQTDAGATVTRTTPVIVVRHYK